MIASRGCNDPLSALLGTELGNEIDPTSHFEGANWLVVFVLNIDFGTKQIIHSRVAIERRALQVRANLTLSKQNVLECWGLHGSRSFVIVLSLPLLHNGRKYPKRKEANACLLCQPIQRWRRFA